LTHLNLPHTSQATNLTAIALTAKLSDPPATPTSSAPIAVIITANVRKPSHHSLLKGQKTMSEQVRNSHVMQSIQIDLEGLITSLRPFYGQGEKSDLLTELAIRLSRMVDKYPAWGWRYVHGVATGNLEPSPRFIRAVQKFTTEQTTIATMQIPGQPARPILVNAIALVRPGSFVLSPSRFCRNPACTIHFVPRVPWQKYCPRCQRKNRRSR
jgi:hypothetical protein